MFCNQCGKEMAENAVMCPECGAPNPNIKNQQPDGNASEKDWLTTLLLCLFLGGLGIHSFYTKKTVIGVIQLLTAGGCGVWALVDLIMIAMGNFKDGEGKTVIRK